MAVPRLRAILLKKASVELPRVLLLRGFGLLVVRFADSACVRFFFAAGSCFFRLASTRSRNLAIPRLMSCCET